MRAHLDIQHEGTLDDGSRVKMQIDSNSTAFLMSILTDLYSDPELAVIREYSTNALDSHKAAGVSGPIEVELPSTLRPLFIVRDHGLGMSVDEIIHNFSKYGWSSKRETNDEVGMLGLGCKSGLTYTSQFTLVATKNGIKATVLVTRETDGAGAIQVIDTVSTYEPNGVEVRIPVKSSATFINKAEHFFRFWAPGSVLVNGKRPVHISQEEGVLPLDPDIVLAKGLGHDYLVMGNVAYPTDRPLFGGTNYRMVAWVPIGSVDFTPAREALQMTRRTQEAVETAKQYVLDALHRKAQADIDQAPNHWEALKRVESWRKVTSQSRHLYSIPFYYRNEQVPSMPVSVGMDALRWIGPSLSNASERPHDVGLNAVERSVFLVGHSGRSLTRQDKERLVKWLAAEDLPPSTPVIALPRLPAQPWFDIKARVLHLDDLRKIEVEKQVSPVGKNIHGQYRVLNRNGDIRITSKLEEHVVWMPADLRIGRASIMEFLGYFHDVSVVPVPKAQLARFLKENPGALSHKVFIEAMVYLFVTSLQPGDLARLTIREEINSSRIGELWKVKDQIQDPEIVELLDIIGQVQQHVGYNVNDIWRWLATACAHPSVSIPVPVFGPDAKLVRRLQAVRHRYPLLGHLGYGGFNGRIESSHYVRYINLIHHSES